MEWNIKKRYLFLVAILLISLTIRLWMVDKRWINPDEGAHMMDAVLALDGKVPLVDYDARKPLYVYLIAIVLKFFGVSYTVGRLLPITCSMLSGILVFLIGRKLFSEEVGLLAATIFSLLPLEVLYSATVKTEPVVVLITCISIYCATLYLPDKNGKWLFAAGIFAAMGFYVRESALVIPVVIIAYILSIYGNQMRKIVRGLTIFGVGYMGVVLVVLSAYSRFYKPSDLIRSSLSPFGFVFSAVEGLLSAPDGGAVASVVSTPIDFNESMGQYIRYIQQAVDLHAFLFVGLGLSVALFVWHVLAQKNKGMKRELIISYSIPYAWIVCIFMAYSYYLFTRGFFIPYFREFLPPLVLIFSAWLISAVPALRKEGILEKAIVVGLGLAILIFLIQSNYRDFYGRGFHASIAITLITLVVYLRTYKELKTRLMFSISLVGVLFLIIISRHGVLKPYLSGLLPSLIMIGLVYVITFVLMESKTRQVILNYWKFIALSIVFGSFITSLCYSAVLLSLSYDSVWSPQSIKKGAAYISANTRRGDEVMSGGVIWELQALRRPFLMISHPLAYKKSMSESKKLAIELASQRRPPKMIVLDGYTEMTYFRHVPKLIEMLENKYELKKTVGPANYPVKIYQLREKATILEEEAFLPFHHPIAEHG